MNSRRKFIKKSCIGALAVTILPSFTITNSKKTKITILHTNDTHSRINPFKNGKYKGYGGMAQRAAIINDVRKKNEHVLLLDAGDIFQGTPYFNYFKGELEFKLMSEMKYDAATLGNHDFDNGLYGLAKQLPNAKFPFLIANYNFDKTILKNKFQKYKIFNKGGIKIGVFGIGIKLDGLVPKELYGNVIYENPINKSNEIAKYLKREKKCDLIICLSHLGLKYDEDKYSDVLLAQQSKYIDLIIGGHTHSFLKEPIKIYNKEKKEVIINQVGWGGINLGKIDFHFNRNILLNTTFGGPIFVKKNTKLI
tara:strand:- start:489 stop:1412 length:924 start_codon:yes stop_codon:yes gene_type:complete